MYKLLKRAIVLCLISGNVTIVMFLYMQSDQCGRNAQEKFPYPHEINHPRSVIESSKTNTSTRENDFIMSLVVPFRDRFEELLVFAPAIHKFLQKQKIRHKISVINQVDSLRYVNLFLNLIQNITFFILF